jgi:hypothetical protein
MLINGKSTRFNERIRLRLPLQVVYRENEDEEWTQNTLTEQVTICGIGFSLSRPVEPKRLINLQLAMPPRFRLFDYGREKYSVWGVIRHLEMLEAKASDTIRVMVGTALIGGEPPESFLNDPKTLYDLNPILRKGSFWSWREQPRMTGRYRRSAEERRDIKTSVILQTLNEEGRICETATGETLNISESGTAVVTKLATPPAKFVLIKTADGGNGILCAVRGSHQLDFTDSIRLHLEFISGKWKF